MLNYLSRFSCTARRPIYHGRGNPCNFGIPTSVYSRDSVCPFTNISSCYERIRGYRKSTDKTLVSTLDVINTCTKGNTDHVHLNNYQKCKFHSSLKCSANRRGYGEYQDPEKRRANIYILMTVLLAVSVIWGLSKMDQSPYDKPAQKAEKL